MVGKYPDIIFLKPTTIFFFFLGGALYFVSLANPLILVVQEGSWWTYKEPMSMFFWKYRCSSDGTVLDVFHW